MATPWWVDVEQRRLISYGSGFYSGNKVERSCIRACSLKAEFKSRGLLVGTLCLRVSRRQGQNKDMQQRTGRKSTRRGARAAESDSLLMS